jgi:hypothetical protein
VRIDQVTHAVRSRSRHAGVTACDERYVHDVEDVRLRLGWRLGVKAGNGDVDCMACVAAEPRP